MMKEQTDPLWGSSGKSMSNKSTAEIKELKEQAKKDRQKKAAAHYESQTFKCSDDMIFNLEQIQPNERTYLSNTIKNVLGDFKWFEKAIQSKKTHIYLGLDNTVPGTPEVKDIDIDGGSSNCFTFLKNNTEKLSHHKHGKSNSSKSHKKQRPPELTMGKKKDKKDEKMNSDVEKILKEMTQQDLPLLTDIETPVKVDNQFAFPSHASSHNIVSKLPPPSMSEEELASRSLCDVVKTDEDIKEELLDDSQYAPEDLSRFSKDITIEYNSSMKEKKKDLPLLHEISPGALKSKSNEYFRIVSGETTPLILNSQSETSRAKNVNSIDSGLINVTNSTSHQSSKDIVNIKDVALNNIPSSKDNHTKSSLENPVTSFSSFLSSNDNSFLDPTMNFLIEKPVSPVSPLFDLGLSTNANDALLDMFTPHEMSTLDLPSSISETLPGISTSNSSNDISTDWNIEPNPSLLLGKKMKGVGNLYQKDRKHTPVEPLVKATKINIDENNKLAVKINETKDKAKSKSTRQELQPLETQKLTSPTKFQKDKKTLSSSEISQNSNEPHKKLIAKNNHDKKVNRIDLVNDTATKLTIPENIEIKEEEDLTQENFVHNLLPKNKNEIHTTTSGNKIDTLQYPIQQFPIHKPKKLHSSPTKTNEQNVNVINPSANLIKTEESSSYQNPLTDSIDILSKPTPPNLVKNLITNTSSDRQVNSITVMGRLPTSPLKEKISPKSDSSYRSHEILNRFPLSPTKTVISPMSSPGESIQTEVDSGVFSMKTESGNSQDEDTDFTKKNENNLTITVDTKEENFSDMEICTPVDEKPIILNEVTESVQNSTNVVPIKNVQNKDIHKISHKPHTKRKHINEENVVNKKIAQKHSAPPPTNPLDRLTVKIPLKSIRLKHGLSLKQSQHPHKKDNKSIQLASTNDTENSSELAKKKQKLDKVTNNKNESNSISNEPSNANTSSISDDINKKLVVKIHLSKLKRPPMKNAPAEKKNKKDVIDDRLKGSEIVNSLQSPKDNSLVQSPLKINENDKTKRKRGRPRSDAKKKSDHHNSKLTPSEISSLKDIVKPRNCFEIKESISNAEKTERYKTSYSTFFEEGQRKKRVADSLKDPIEKGYEYIEAVLNYVQYMVGYELAAKKNMKHSIDKICSDCIKLVEFVLKHYCRKGQADSNSSRFSYLCLSLQSMFYMKLFKLKKELLYKQSKVLSEYYKQYKSKAQSGPSPQVPNNNSPGPSPSKAFITSNGSTSSNSSCSGGTNNAMTVSIPTDMNEKAQQYLHETRFILHAHRLWDEAERSAFDCKSFVESLSSKVGCLTMQSPLLHVHEYISSGLLILKESAIT